MPPRKQHASKRPKRKMNYRKAKQVVAKTNRKLKSKNMDTFALTCRNTVQLVPVQGATVANYIYNFFPLLDNGTSYSYGLVKNAEFILYKQMYDQFRVNSITIKVVPKANVLDQFYNQADSALTNYGDGLYHTAIDRDTAVPWNITMISRYPSYRKYNVKKSWNRTYKITWPKGVWLDCQSPFEDLSLLNRLGCNGGIGVYAENFLEDVAELVNEPVANVVVQFNVVFRGKVNAQLNLNEDGTVTIKHVDLGDAPPFSPAITTGGTFNNARIVSTADTGLVTTPENDYSQP